MTLRDTLNDLAIDMGLVDDRAGRYARHLARERQKAFLQASWRRLLLVLVIGVAAVGLTEFLPTWARGFVAGAWLASLGWLLVLLVVQATGTASTMMGGTAEQWTAQELRRLRRRGWKVVSHTMPTFGDIDHIAVGPGGLIVFETKWRSDPQAFENHEWLEAECHKLTESGRLIRLSLKARLQGALTQAVLVYWGPGATGHVKPPEPLVVGGVEVISGPELRHWLDSIPNEASLVMDKPAIDSAWETLTDIARKTDRRDFGVDATAPATPMRHVFDLGIGIFTGLISFYAAGLCFRWLHTAIFFPVVIVAVAVGMVVRFRKRATSLSRFVGLAATVGFGSFLVLIACLYGYSAVVHG